MQVKGNVYVNDETRLEQEANVMGEKALNINASSSSKNQIAGNFNKKRIIQRVLLNEERNRLTPLLGKPKTKILAKPEYDKAQDKVKKMSDMRLQELKGISIIEFTEILTQLNNEPEANVAENIETAGQGLELSGALLESSKPVLAALDLGMETLGGGISAGLDINKGVKGIQKGKTTEGGSLLTSGVLGGVSAMAGTELLPSLSSAAGLIPGIPDLFATASAASKLFSGCAQLINTKSNLHHYVPLKLK